MFPLLAPPARHSLLSFALLHAFCFALRSAPRASFFFAPLFSVDSDLSALLPTLLFSLRPSLFPILQSYALIALCQVLCALFLEHIFSQRMTVCSALWLSICFSHVVSFCAFYRFRFCPSISFAIQSLVCAGLRLRWQQPVFVCAQAAASTPRLLNTSTHHLSTSGGCRRPSDAGFCLPPVASSDGHSGCVARHFKKTKGPVPLLGAQIHDFPCLPFFTS